LKEQTQVTKSTHCRPQLTLNNSIIYILIVNGRSPLSLFIHSVDEAGVVAMDASGC